jgi:phytoene dehydrogenase-like protein
MSRRTDVVIVGGGLAGLAAARRLQRDGVDYTLHEAGDRLGGRVATDLVDGYRIDRGFQVLNTAYPRLRRLVDLDRLRLCYFTPGVLVRRQGRLHRLVNPLQEPTKAFASVTAGVGNLAERTRFAALASRYSVTDPRKLLTEPETAASEALHDLGDLREQVLRPFLSGVLGDPDLGTSSHVLAMVLRSFARGRIAVPANGMGELATAIAAPLDPARIRLNSPVDHLPTAGAVLVATDPVTAHRLLPRLPEPRMRPLTTYYYATDRAPLDEPTLVLDGDGRGIVANTVVPTQAAPGYAPLGQHLVAASVVGTGSEGVAAELGRLYQVPTDGWTEVARVTAALPDAAPPRGQLTAPVDLGDGVFVAGDHRDSPSIQGALASGWRAAKAIQRHLLS